MLKSMSTILLVLVVLKSSQVQCKVYTRCGLLKDLVKLGFSRTFLGNWVCLIESESGKDTSKQISKANGSKGLGLFQISSKDWCAFSKSGGKCNMKCEDLLNEDLTDDAKCAQKAFNEMGFRGWEGWMRSCYRRKLPIPNC